MAEKRALRERAAAVVHDLDLFAIAAAGRAAHRQLSRDRDLSPLLDGGLMARVRQRLAGVRPGRVQQEVLPLSRGRVFWVRHRRRRLQVEHVALAVRLAARLAGLGIEILNHYGSTPRLLTRSCRSQIYM